MSAVSPKARRSYSRSRSPPPSREYRDPGGEENVGTVFVGNLNHDTSEKTLREFFEQYGRVLEAKVVHDPETGRSRGFGFVKFEDPRDADDAISEADGRSLDGRQIKCNMAKYSRGGFRGGGGGFRGDFRGGYRGDRGGFRGRMGPPMRGGYYHGPPSYHDGRGMDRGPLRRSRSRSLGRYSPGRSPGRGAVGNRKRKAVGGSPGGSYSTDSKSTGSYTTTGSDTDSKSPRRRNVRARPGGEVQQPGAGPAAQIADQGTIKKELVQAKRRESEWQSRMAALEAEVKTVKAAREDDSAKFTELSEMLQKSEDTVKQYRKWLQAICNYTREMLVAQEAFDAAKEERKGRLEDLALFLQETESFVATEKGKSSRRRRKDVEGVAVEGGDNPPAVTAEADAPVEAPLESKPLTLPAVTIPNGV